MSEIYTEHTLSDAGTIREEHAQPENTNKQHEDHQNNSKLTISPQKTTLCENIQNSYNPSSKLPMTKNPGKLTCEPIIPTNSSNTNSNNNPEAKEVIPSPQKEFFTPNEKIEHLENQVKKLLGELKTKKFQLDNMTMARNNFEKELKRMKGQQRATNHKFEHNRNQQETLKLDYIANLKKYAELKNDYNQIYEYKLKYEVLTQITESDYRPIFENQNASLEGKMKLFFDKLIMCESKIRSMDKQAEKDMQKLDRALDEKNKAFKREQQALLKLEELQEKYDKLVRNGVASNKSQKGQLKPKATKAVKNGPKSGKNAANWSKQVVKARPKFKLTGQNTAEEMSKQANIKAANYAVDADDDLEDISPEDFEKELIKAAKNSKTKSSKSAKFDQNTQLMGKRAQPSPEKAKKSPKQVTDSTEKKLSVQDQNQQKTPAENVFTLRAEPRKPTKSSKSSKSRKKGTRGGKASNLIKKATNKFSGKNEKDLFNSSRIQGSEQNKQKAAYWNKFFNGKK